ncbi:hypothetical protein AQUCO_11500011v1 [Aquilegia coerulea]|uniref:Knottin scorpion toxin-like domain-containing protein n=1 Tax=Aquilegia coerulea TaxID=218851 RepID=A0A2G5C2A8_AQUCA|nr:hypothetical protein AQUCO_11500011v1 [Aquilegia coerulea]
MATETTVSARSTMGLVLMMILLSFAITGVKSQGSITMCYAACGGEMLGCWPKCSIQGPLIYSCLTKCISDGTKCYMDCR